MAKPDNDKPIKPSETKPEGIDINVRPEDDVVINVKYKVVVTIWDVNGNPIRQYDKFFNTRIQAERYKRILKQQHDSRRPPIISSIEIIKIDENKSVSKVHSKTLNRIRRRLRRK